MSGNTLGSDLFDRCLHRCRELLREDGRCDPRDLHAEETVDDRRVTDQMAWDGLAREAVHTLLQIVDDEFAGHDESYRNELWVQASREVTAEVMDYLIALGPDPSKALASLARSFSSWP